MSVLLLHGRTSRGIVDYSKKLQHDILTINDEIMCVDSFMNTTQQQAQDTLKNIVDRSSHHNIHIQHDTKLFMSDACEYENLENLAWFLNYIHTSNRHAVITFHGMIDYNHVGSDGFIGRLLEGKLNKLFKSIVVPELNNSQVVVHSHDHQYTLARAGVNNIHVIPSAVAQHSRLTSDVVDKNAIKLVVPGHRSDYKQYELAIECVRNLPSNYTLYISSEEPEGVWSNDRVFRCIRDSHMMDRVILTKFSNDKKEYLDQLSMFDGALLPYTNAAPESGSLHDCLSVNMICFVPGQDEFRYFNQRYDCLPQTGNIHDLDVMIHTVLRNPSEIKRLKQNIVKAQESLGVVHNRLRYNKVYKDFANIEIDLDKRNVAFMGSSHPPNIDAVKKIAKMATNLTEWNFNIIGSVCDYYLYRWEVDDCLSSNMKLHGVVTDQQKSNILSSCDAALNMVESGSGTNLKMLDYLAAGLPTISTSTGMRGLDIPDDMVIQCDISNIESVLSGSVKTKARPTDIRRYIHNTYDWSVISKKYYNNILKQYTNKIVVTNTFDVYPPNSGGKNRIFYIYREIAKHVPVVMICVVPPHVGYSKLEIAENLTQICIPKTDEHMALERKLEQDKPASLGDISVELYHTHTPQIAETISKEAKDADVVICSHPYTISAVLSNSDKPIIYESHNVEYMLKKQIYDDACDDILEDVKNCESLACSKATTIITCSDADQKSLKRLYGINTTMMTVPNGTNTDSIQIVNNKKTKNNVINIFMCCRDNEEELPTILGKFKIMERRSPDLEFRYYIFENDSTDTTLEQITDFFLNSNGKYKHESGTKTKWGPVATGDRVRDMAEYRNKMKNLCVDWTDSDYSFVVDTGVEFSTKIIDQHIQFMQSNPNVVMSTPFGIHPELNRYYDLYALKLLNGPGGLDMLNEGLNVEEYISRNNNTLVDSAFGGFACIRTHVLEKCTWSVWNGQYSEHVPFCLQVKSHGDIMIVGDIRVEWVI